MNQSEKNEKKHPYINLPSKFFLTDRGESHFYQRNIPLHELHSYDGRKGFGFQWANFNAKIVQKLITKTFFKEICIERFEFLTKRADIIDLTKLIVYALLYEEAAVDVATIFIKSEMVAMLNAKNPRKKITLESDFNQKILDDFFKSREDELKALHEMMLLDPFVIIDEDKELKPEEKEMKKNVVRNFINAIDAKSWFLFHFICKSMEKVDILSELNTLLISYLKKTKIADYVALMLLELAGQAERVSFEKLARMKKLLGEIEFEEYFASADNRKKLLDLAEKNNHRMVLDYKFSELMRGQSGKHSVLTITMINPGLMIEKARREFKEKMDTDTREKGLGDFFKNMPPEKMAQSGMGMFYLSFLEEACNAEKLKFDARIVCDDKKEETLFILTLHF